MDAYDSDGEEVLVRQRKKTKTKRFEDDGK
jgi:hypothetical protein